MQRSGVADLPLHGGRVPSWLAERMTKLGTAVTETIVMNYGASAFLSRLSDPFWFQAFGSVMGMDWHSSGITTSVDSAKVGRTDKMDGFRRLDRFVRAVETQLKPEAEFDAVIAHEKAISRSLNGRSVFDPKPRRRSRNNHRQRLLF